MLYRAELLPVFNVCRGRRHRRPVRRTGWDSNPRGLLTPHDFQSCSLSLSDTRPAWPPAPGSRAGNPQRRGWDSNPRGPCEPDGLANRCRNHLATSPNRRPFRPLGRDVPHCSAAYPDTSPRCEPRALRASSETQLSWRIPLPRHGIPPAAPHTSPCDQMARATLVFRRAPNCPSWVRTRTLLIQSQACCQLHQGAGKTVVRCQTPSLKGVGTSVELRGLEPLTSWVRSRRSPS